METLIINNQAQVNTKFDTKPELFYENKQILRQIELNIQQGKECIQGIVDEFMSLTSSPITIEEIQGFVGSGRSDYMLINRKAILTTIKEKLNDNEYSNSLSDNLAENQNDQSDLIEVPDPDIENLIAAIKKLNYIQNVNFFEIIHWQCYQVQNEKVIIIPDEVNQAEAGFRIFAVSQQEKIKLTQVRELCNCLNHILSENHKEIAPGNLEIRGVAHYDNEAKSFFPAERFIKYGFNRIIP